MKETEMVKKKDSKPTSGSRVETTPSSSLTASPSGGSTPLNVCNTQATDWYKVHLPFKNPHFKVSKGNPTLSLIKLL